MNEAPEQIWAVTEPDDISAQILGEVYAQQTPEGMVGTPTKYVRADLRPTVNPLEWVDASEYLDCAICDTFGLYQIADEDHVVLFIGHSSEGQIYETVEAAKAAAQADFVSRMTLHLDLAPVTPAQAAKVNIDDVKFLENAASYFENRDTKGEDLAHWSNVYNAENCRRIAGYLRAIAEGDQP